MGCCQSSQSEVPLYSRADTVKSRKGTLQTHYEILETLGRGSYGTVSKVRDRKTKLIRAMKELKKAEIPEDQLKLIQNEITLLTELDHPNIMKIYETIESLKSNYIICECLTGGELFEMLKKKKNFPEKTVCKYMYDVFAALTYLHDMKIVHSDLKLENLILESNEPGARVKLIDFGVSRKMEGNSLSGKVGSIHYLAPEVFDDNYNEKVDIWSAGVVMYLMLSGTLPYKFSNEEDYVKNIKTGSLDLEKGVWTKVSDECKDLLKKLLNFDPNKRVAASRAMKHPWFKEQVENSMSSIQISFCENLKSFKKTNKVVTSILVYITSQMLTNQEESPLGQMFRALDTDGNGKLSREELLQASNSFKLFTPEEVEEIFENCDMDKSGFIDYSEFLTASMSWNQVFNKEKVQMVFSYFDSEKCGNLSLEELKKNFVNVSETEWKEFLGEVDTNKDGNISLQEFKEYIVSFISN